MAKRTSYYKGLMAESKVADHYMQYGHKEKASRMKTAYGEVDLVIDAIDSLVPKVTLLEGCIRREIPVLASIPQDDDLRKKSANYQIVGTGKSEWGALFAELGDNVAIAPPMRPTALDQDGLLALFDSKDTGGNYVLVPATDQDMRGKNAVVKESLEVVYDDA